MIDKQQDFLTLTGAARRARSEGYDITEPGVPALPHPQLIRPSALGILDAEGIF